MGASSTPEGRVKAGIKKVLDAWGIWYFMPVSNGMGKVGVPDFICCARGLFLGIEAKAPGKRSHTTPNQQRVMSEIKDHTGHVLVVDHPDQLTLFLEGLFP